MSLFEPLFAALEQAAIRYVVVGGMATVLHGYARLTEDTLGLAHPMREVDVFVVNPIEFDLLYDRSQLVALTSTRVRIASIEDLIPLKRLATDLRICAISRHSRPFGGNMPMTISECTSRLNVTENARGKCN